MECPRLHYFIFLFFLIHLSHGAVEDAEVLQDTEVLLETSGDHNDLISAPKYKCPFPFGTFGHPDDCSKFYVCVGGAAFEKKCKKFMKFDIIRRMCVPSIIAICGKNGKGGGDNDKEATTDSSHTTPAKSKFTCPSFSGNYPDPNDCSKYFSCAIFIPISRSCPDKQLFDAIKKSCEAAEHVHCGEREKPPQYTTPEPTEETEEVTSPLPETTPPATDPETEEVTSPKDDITTVETTTEQRQTPPDHDCDPDDVDCIIDETGEPDAWFKCPQEIGSYPHPSSDKLFIFCMNWVPSVKKCGMDLVFSKELSTCVEVK